MTRSAPALLIVLTLTPSLCGDVLSEAFYRPDLGWIRERLRSEPDAVHCQGEFRLRAWATLPAFPRVAKLLRAHGAELDVFGAAALGEWPWLLAALRADPGLVRSQLLDDATPLHLACRHGQWAAAVVLLGRGTEVAARDHRGSTPLHEAAAGGYTALVKLLLLCGAAVDGPPDGAGEEAPPATPLLRAAQAGRKRTVRLLLARGAAVNRRHPSEGTPLHALTRWIDPDHFVAGGEAPDYPGTARVLIEHGADPFLPVRPDDPSSAFELAVGHNGRREVAEVLLVRWPQTDIFDAAARGDRDRVARLLADDPGRADVTGPLELGPLYWAVERGHESVVRLLLRHGARPDAGFAEFSALAVATRDQRVALLPLLIDHLPDDRFRPNDLARTLAVAAGRGRLEAVRVLLARGARPDQVVDGSTALHQAVGAGKAEALKLLLEGRPNLRVLDDEGESLLSTAIRAGRRDLLVALLDSGAHIRTPGPSPLHLATALGNAEAVSVLIRRGANVNLADTAGATPLHLACEGGHVAAAKALLAARAETNLFDAQGRTPLHRAADHGIAELVDLLLLHGAAAGVYVPGGRPPLVIQLPGRNDLPILCGNALLDRPPLPPPPPGSGNYLRTVRLLLSHEPDVRGRYNGKTLVEWTAENVPDAAAIIPELFAQDAPGTFVQMAAFASLDRVKACVRADRGLLEREGTQALSAASANGNVAVMKYLLDSGVVVDSLVYTAPPLRTAAAQGQLAAARLLLAHKARVDGNVIDDAGNLNFATPLHLAADRGHRQLAALLLAHQADPNAADLDGQTPLHLAAARGDVGMIRLLTEAGADANARDLLGARPIHELAQGDEDMPEAAAALRRAGARLWARDRDGRTPLHHAAERGHHDLARFLLDHGADVDTADRDGRTPLHLAVQVYMRGSVVPLLLRHGADPNVRDAQGRTPLSLPTTETIRTLLRKYGARE